jgi:hypothetical protein
MTHATGHTEPDTAITTAATAATTGVRPIHTFDVYAQPSNADIPALEALKFRNRWVLHTNYNTGEQAEEIIDFHGRLLGFNSSRHRTHNHPFVAVTEHGQTFVTADTAMSKCNACRWSEVRIFRQLPDDDQQPSEHNQRPDAPYVVHTLGVSTVQGEITRSTGRFAMSGYEVVELLTIRRGKENQPFLPAAFARALAAAAGTDEGIADGFVNRATV